MVGTWGFLTNWQKLEGPFWKDALPAASKGNITAAAKARWEIDLLSPSDIVKSRCRRTA